MAEPLRAPAARRLVAFGIDYLVLAVYVAVLTGLSLSLGGDRAPPSSWSEKLTGHALAFVTLTLPVTLYFAVGESAWGATLGKAVLRLRVIGGDGARPKFSQAFVRNALKFAPWELAHVAIWYVPGRPFLDAPGALNLAGWAVSLGLALVWFAGLPGGRTVYDRASGTWVRTRAAMPLSSATA